MKILQSIDIIVLPVAIEGWASLSLHWELYLLLNERERVIVLRYVIRYSVLYDRPISLGDRGFQAASTHLVFSAPILKQQAFH